MSFRPGDRSNKASSKPLSSACSGQRSVITLLSSANRTASHRLVGIRLFRRTSLCSRTTCTLPHMVNGFLPGQEPSRHRLYLSKRREHHPHVHIFKVANPPLVLKPDRKSTRLNSSHVAISYAVFCLKIKIK